MFMSRLPLSCDPKLEITPSTRMLDEPGLCAAGQEFEYLHSIEGRCFEKSRRGFAELPGRADNQGNLEGMTVRAS
jgi:hypothetical protein